MIHVEVNDIYERKYTVLWSILSFKAGLLNAAGFLLAGSYVSHVTGFGTQVGISLGHKEYNFGIELLIIPIAFIAGAFLTAWILDRNYNKDKIPDYPKVQVLITFLLGIICIFFSVGIFEPVSAMGQDKYSIYLIAILCLVCGLKNGLTTWATHGKIRTTHVTGLSTDIGLHFLKVFRPEGSSSRYPEKKKVTYVRIITLFSFSIGSCLSAVLIPVIGYKVFHFALAISLCLLLVSIMSRRKKLEEKHNENINKTDATKHFAQTSY